MQEGHEVPQAAGEGSAAGQPKGAEPQPSERGVGEGGESLLGLGEPGGSGALHEAGLGGGKSADAEAEIVSAEDGDGEPDSPAPANPGRKVSETGHSDRRALTDAQIVRALELCNYDFTLAGKVLGTTGERLRIRAKKSAKLAALLDRTPGAPPAPTDMVYRKPPAEPPVIAENTALGEQLLKVNREILRNGLEKAGIQKSTIEKLRAFDGFAPNAGEFLISALDLTHRSMVFLSVHLLEEAQRIKTDYLDDETLEHEYKIQWQSAYNDIVEQIGKCYDRTLTGTQAMAKMIGTDQPDKKKKKPGFKELKRVEPTKNG